eukprot:365602-Chlamydomonas_euryale.AAC.1
MVLDFGHEILNSVYFPLRYVHVHPCIEEFFDRLRSCHLSSWKVRHEGAHGRAASWLSPQQLEGEA